MAEKKNSESFTFLVAVAVVGTVVGGLILAALTTSWLPDSYHFLCREGSLVFSWIYSAVIWFLTDKYTVPAWLIILLVALSIYAVVDRVAYVIDKRKKATEEYKTSSEHYRRDTFDGVIWTWEYWESRIVRLNPICEADGTPMVYHTGLVTQLSYEKREMTYLRCETCGHTTPAVSGSVQFFEEKVMRQILRKIHTREYLKMIPQQ